MAIKNSRILNTNQLVSQIIESNKNGERFCFILGSGASVESGIPSGNALEMQWMNYIMCQTDEDNGGENKLGVKHAREWAKTLYDDGLIQHSFDEIEKAWIEAKANNKSIPSKYYFDIYKLRFYPNKRNGHRFLEGIMENCEPSLGYHTLALLLTENNNNNLVITTNFDSLVEDALFLYTNKKPLVVGHESLANYIESDIQRPIIAKVHRGLMYAPFNSPETTNELKAEWREALNYVFSTYTPIVIGYGGGDHSLMAFMEEDTTLLRHGVYWCYREKSGLPEEGIQDFLEKKDGYLVSIGGFDALMMEIGKRLYNDIITPSSTNNNLKNQYDRRIQKYKEQWKKLNQDPSIKQVLQSMNETEQQKEEMRAENNELTAWDYIRRGDTAYNEEHYEEALEAYTKVIELRGDFASDYYNRAAAYIELEKYDEAIEDLNRAIEINPNATVVYNDLGYVYAVMEQYEKAIMNFDRAIEINPRNAQAYNNRGWVYCEQGLLDEAMENTNKAIELDPKDLDFYSNRARIYNKLGEYEKALEECSAVIKEAPDKSYPYNHCGDAYYGLGKFQEAIKEYTHAIKLDAKYKTAYQGRAKAYRAIGKEMIAEADEKRANELD